VERPSDENRPINPNMVTLAREARGLTQEEAARELGITQARLSKIESGSRDAPEDVVMKMESAFRYPRRFFSLDIPILGPGSSEFFHRKRQSLSARTLRQVHAEVNIRIMNLSRLLRAVEIEQGEIPRIDPEEGWTPADIARAIRAEWQLPRGPVTDLIGVIEKSGGIVVTWDFGTPRLDALSRYMPGMPRMFFLNEALPADRQRLSLAHELGHVIMHQTPHPHMEDEAYQFAAEFLMPESDIRPQFDEVALPKLALMKPHWRVSMAALLKRAQDVGKISERRARYLWTQMGKSGYRTREPSEVDIPRELPRLLETVLTFYQTELGYGLAELSHLVVLQDEEAQLKYGIQATKDEMRTRLRAV
jgi:Zn-dependent peptidase ImmA (M78 family)/DNA-binding XRE family transcriptional regulator